MTAWVLSPSVLILTVIALRYLLRGKISLRMQYAPVAFGAGSVTGPGELRRQLPQRDERGAGADTDCPS